MTSAILKRAPAGKSIRMPKRTALLISRLNTYPWSTLEGVIGRTSPKIKVAVLKWSAIIRIARVTSLPSPYFIPESSSIFLIIGVNKSVS